MCKNPETKKLERAAWDGSPGTAQGEVERKLLGNLDSHVNREEFHLAKARNYFPLPDKDLNAAISDSLHSVCVQGTLWMRANGNTFH